MGSGPPERTSPDPLLGSQNTQGTHNQTTQVTISGECGRSREAGPTAFLSLLKQRTWAEYWAVLSMILIPILIIVLVTRSEKKCESPPPAPVYIVAACPDGWVGYLRKCYYFSEGEANWTSSQSKCSALSASLAGIDTQQEMDFMKRYKGSSDYWIGLQKKLTWKWASGTEFNNWFPIQGGEKCAFLNQKDVGSSGCSWERPFICSKPMEKTEGNAK